MNKAKLIAILVLAIALGAVVIQNRAPVQTHFVFITVEMPHILLLVLTAGAGFCLGLLVPLFARSGAGRQPPGGAGN
ncbi:MAG: LapA family protein [Betaproteobacteria bacterium]|nr:LapA family protein [Betaproteobacteria bacterium]